MKNKEQKETKEPGTFQKGYEAGKRSCSALKSIFISIATAITGKKKPGLLARFGATFLAILGWLFFSVAFVPALASVGCTVAAESLKGEEECLEESTSKSNPSSLQSVPE